MSPTAKPIDTARFADRLRARAIDLANKRILISLISGSSQEVDLTSPATCNGLGRVRHFRRDTEAGWPTNPLPIVPACRALGLSPTPSMMTALVFQNAACAWRCWYCYVPEEMLRADTTRSRWLTAEELVELYAAVPDRPCILDLSGGSPDLVPEWTAWMMDALLRAGLDQSTYLWSDDNLSTTYLFDRLDPKDLARIREYPNYGRVCCIKGYDARSFSFNTRARESDFDGQFRILRKLLSVGLDLYGYVTLTSPYADHVTAGVADLMDRLQELDANFPLRVVPLKIQVFTPVKIRLAKHDGRERSLAIQEEAVAAWNNEMRRRFSQSARTVPICDVPLTEGRSL